VSGVDYAPHRRAGRGRLTGAASRAWERSVVAGFRAASALLVRLPLRVSEPVARAGFLAGYALWPAKRRIIKANAAHVLGLPTDHPDVARLALELLHPERAAIVLVGPADALAPQLQDLGPIEIVRP